MENLPDEDPVLHPIEALQLGSPGDRPPSIWVGQVLRHVRYSLDPHFPKILRNLQADKQPLSAKENAQFY